MASTSRSQGSAAGPSSSSSSSNSTPADLHPIGACRRFKPNSASTVDTTTAWRAYRDATRRTVLQTYQILGFLSSGTYGRVYKACLRDPEDANRFGSSASKSSRGRGIPLSAREEDPGGGVYAIKKFKPDKELDAATYTGISQSAMREIALSRELRHENVVTLREVLLEDKSIYMVFSYASHDFLQLIHHHSTVLRTPIPPAVLKSLLFQLLSGVHYLHSNWVLHRDLKPANILLTSSGVVKIGDLGLARLYSQPLQPLYNGDKVVVTIWYRAPELLMGARHYTPAIDMWAVGCIWGEILSLRPLFKGEEAKPDGKSKGSVLQIDQMSKIIEILGPPNGQRWPTIETMPDWRSYWQTMRLGSDNHPKVLHPWYHSRFRSSSGYDLFEALLQYDPAKRLTAKQALDHAWFKEDPIPTANAFASLPHPTSTYPSRRLHSDTTDPVLAVDPSQVAPPPVFASAATGGTALPVPGPLAPPAAPASAGSLPNSVGPSQSLLPASGLGGPGGSGSGGGNTGGGMGGPSLNQSSKGGMVATATANAAANASQPVNKRPRMG